MEADRRRARDTRAALAGLLALSLVAKPRALGLPRKPRGHDGAGAGGLRPGLGGGVGLGRAGRYLEDTARTVAVTLLTLTPENAGHVREAARADERARGQGRHRRLGLGGGGDGWPGATSRPPSTR